MFERYTEKARRVIFFARFEASQFGSECIEPEHLLLGLLREVKLDAWLTRQTPAQLRENLSREMRINPKVSTSADLPLSQVAQVVLIRALEHADRNGDKLIDSVHLLLGLMDQDSLAARHLRDAGADPSTARARLLPPVPPDDASGTVAAPGSVANIAKLAIEECGGGIPEPEHVLVAIAREGTTKAARLLANHGLSVDVLRKELGLAT